MDYHLNWEIEAVIVESMKSVRWRLVCLLFIFSTFASAEEPIQPQDNQEGSTATLGLSLGATYLQFQQQFASGANRNLNFESFQAPYVDILLNVSLSEKNKVQINFLRYTPSSTDSNASTSVEQKVLNLRSLGVEYQRVVVGDESTRFSGLMFGGLQLATFPVLTRSGPAAVQAELMNYKLFSLGLGSSYKLGELWQLKGIFRYLYPFSGDAKYEIASPLLADIELEALRTFRKTWQVGFGWLSQMQKYTVSGSAIDPVSTQSFRATQDNLTSSLFLKVTKTW